MLTEKKGLILGFKIFSLLCVVALVTCLICDRIMNKEITWFYYVLTAVPAGWVLLSSFLLAGKNKIVCFLLAFTVVVFPFLFFLDKTTPVNGWFMVMGLPLGLTAVAALWITYLLIRFVKINIWYMASILVGLYGIGVNAVAQYYVRSYVNQDMITLDSIINLLASIAMAVLLVIIGRYSNMNKKRIAELQTQKGQEAGKALEAPEALANKETKEEKTGDK